MHIIGTAGHVDHGKSALVTALTGHNPDRLLEEQQRGMTLDLGFAPLRFADGMEAGIIDVPGHERFLHNMLAGAAGMELLLLVVAATEGPKPQTLEHLQILNFLNVQSAIVVLSKIDLVDGEARALAAELVRDACRGTIAQDAPIVEVSALTGAGIEALKSAIHETLRTLPSRRSDAPAFLPVDRVFALPGHGTIITGTLMQGVIRSGDTLALAPSGLAARIRSLQTFGRALNEAPPGSRVALNLAGVDVHDVARGETLVSARHFQPERELTISFTPVPTALSLLRKRTPIRGHIGSGEIPGVLRFSEVPQNGSAVTAQLSLSRPAVVYPGMRLIVRRMSPKDLLGGAIVTERPTGSTPGFVDEGDSAGLTPASLAVLRELEHSGTQALSVEKLATRTNQLIEHVRAALKLLGDAGHTPTLHKPTEYLARNSFEEAWSAVALLLLDHHTAVPWSVGLTSADIAKARHWQEPLAVRLLNAWHEDGRVHQRGGRWHLPEFVPTLSKQQHAFFEKALGPDSTRTLLPCSHAALVAAAAGNREHAEALESLHIVGALVRIGDDVYRRSQLERAKAMITDVIAKNGAATMAQLRDALGSSRKYALPLMEYLDSSGFTIRDGDLRRIRGR
ncbi:MAG: selenocysteine-specific translation elongation factor [Candidatus Eremiobacteraeota bacterium]|nr:selenocysteine-specific translation elongation factor [Candidatus Eremiobacteraeota bacterium]